MRKTGKACREALVLRGVLALVMALFMVLCVNGFAMTGRAAATGTVTASSVKIRKEAGTNSEMIGSAAQGDTLTINSEVQGSDGNIWYQVVVDANTIGYIRSDLMQKSGEVDTPNTSLTINPSVEVTNVQPVSATVAGGAPVRVRTDASTDGQLITTVENGAAITVNGSANGADGYVWYLVAFNANNTEIQGFIRSDFVTLSGDLIPVENGEGEGGGTQEPSQPAQQPSNASYEVVQKEDGSYYLNDNVKGQEWELPKLLDSYETMSTTFLSNKKTVKTQKIVIIILVVLVIVAVLAATMLYFKVRDISDEAYFTAVEKETIRERNSMKKPDPRAPGRKVMQTVGTQEGQPARQAAGRSQNAAGTRPQSKPSAGQGKVNGNVQNRTAGTSQSRQPVSASGQTRQAAPLGNQSAGGQGRTTAGQSRQSAPVGSKSMSGQSGNSQVRGAGQAAGQSRTAAPAGGQPRQSSAMEGQTMSNQNMGSQTRSSNAAGTQTRTAQPAGSQTRSSVSAAGAQGQARQAAPSGVQPRTAQPRQTEAPKSGRSGQTRNMVSDDDDEFEFEFLNWDGEDN